MNKSMQFLFPGLVLLFAACTDDNELQVEQPALYENGVFITNEGNFGEADGSLSYYDRETGSVSNNLFSSVNPAQSLGDVVQSSYMVQDKLFIVVNNSNKIEVLDIADSLESAYTITELALPRYMTSYEGRGYVTEWVSFADAGRVTIFDLESGAIEGSITTGYGAEGLLVSSGKLFVTNSFSNTLVVIDLGSEQITDTLELGNGPAGMVTDADGDVWVVCSGGYDENFAPLNDGKLVEVDPSGISVKTEVALNQNVSARITTDPAETAIFYFSGKQIFSFKVTETEAPSSPLIEESDAVSFYGIGVDPDGVIYAADARGFAENGEVFRYNSDGTFIDRFAVGRGPNGFSFN